MLLRRLRGGLAGAMLLGLAILPGAWLASRATGSDGLLPLVVDGCAAAVDAVGWVLVPQLLLAVAVLGVALHGATARVAGLTSPPPPRWIDPAVESALLLGMLGTLSGMVKGFVGLSPEALEPGPLVHGLGTALRSSFVGFAIALVGVWVRALPGETPA